MDLIKTQKLEHELGAGNGQQYERLYSRNGMLRSRFELLAYRLGGGCSIP